MRRRVVNSLGVISTFGLWFITSIVLRAQPGDFDQYGGWKAIRATQATGFFRVQKIDERWWFVTPEGNAFFSMGVNHISPGGYDAPALGYSPYERNVKAKHGNVDKWKGATIERLRRWGFNTIGAWSWGELYRVEMPYTVMISFPGSHWLAGKFPDVFDPGFEKGAEERAKEICAPRKDDTWLVGYFLDNELKWSRDWRGGGTLFDDFCALPAETCGKRAFVEFMKERHGGEIDGLNRNWKQAFKSFEEVLHAETLRGSFEIGDPLPSEAAEDEAAFIGLVAERYFKTTTGAVRKWDPNHLVLGCRFVLGAPVPVLKEAAKYLDVVSVNYYRLGGDFAEAGAAAMMGIPSPARMLSNVYRATKRPILITEFSFKAADSGLPNTKGAGLPVLKTQKDRAREFEEYALSCTETSYIVGYHWYAYMDEPKEGRFDGEDCNFGLVDVDDNEYTELVETMSRVNGQIYGTIRSARE